MEQEGYRGEKHSVEWPEALPGSLSMQTRLLPWARRTFHFLYPHPTTFFFFKATFILKAAQEERRGGKRLKEEEKKKR